MSHDAPLDTPFEHPLVDHASKKGGKGTFDHNPCPAVNHPRESGKDAVPEKFYEDIPTGDVQVTTPLGTTLKK